MGEAAATELGKTIVFGQRLNLSSRSQQPKMKTKHVLYLLNEKKNGIQFHLVR